MTESQFTTPSHERMPTIPRQIRGGNDGLGFRILTDTQQVADAATQGEIVGTGNKSVYALLGTCAIIKDEEKYTPTTVPEKIEHIKGEARRGRPLGLTIPFTHKSLIGAFETRHITDKRLRQFMEPDELTLVVGGLGFVRGDVNEEVIEKNHLPGCVISRPGQASHGEGATVPLVQAYSPEGNRTATLIINRMLDRGALPIMSSANKSGEPEITTTAKALKFAQEHNIPLFIDVEDSQRPQRPQGSYPIFQIMESEIHIVRQDFLDTAILRHLLHDLPVSAEMPVHPRPELAERHMLRLSDLLEHDSKAENYRGADMRKCLLEYLGIE